MSLLLALVAMAAIHTGCTVFGGSDDNSNADGGDTGNNAANDGNTPGGNGDDGATGNDDATGNDGTGDGSSDDGTPLQDDFTPGSGALEGYIYANPARSVGLRQATGNFILSAVADPEATAPTAGTRVFSSGAGLATTLDASGRYAFDDVPAEVLSIGVQETLGDGTVVSETFPDILVAPDHTTLGATAPSGVSISASPMTGSLATGESLSATASLSDADGVIDDFRDFDWSSSAPSVATVDATGTERAEIRGVAAGTATIEVAAGPLAASIAVTVEGSGASATLMDVDVSFALTGEGLDTRVTSLTILPEEGASISVSESGTAAFLVSSPDGSARSIPARTVGQSLGPDGTLLLRSSGSDGAERASISLIVSGGDLVLRRGTSGSLSISNRVQISFPVTGPGEAILPITVGISVPLTGSLSDGSLSLPGLPDGTTAMVILSQESGAQVSAAGTSGNGELIVDGFPDAAIPDDISDVVISITGP